MHHHDALALLPRTPVLCFPKRCAIYGQFQQPQPPFPGPGRKCQAQLHGNRRHPIDDPDRAARRFLRRELAGSPDGPLRETAIAVAPTQVMSWTAEEVEVHIERQPRLALALCEYFGHCNEQMRERIVTVATQKTGTRVSVALVQLAREIGDRAPTARGGSMASHTRYSRSISALRAKS